MARAGLAGAVIFSGDKNRLAAFYAAISGFPVTTSNESVTVLESNGVQIVLHALDGETAGPGPMARDAFVKPFFELSSLSQARHLVESLGGRAEPPSLEWSGPSFRAFEATDPDGNPIQFRQAGA